MKSNQILYRVITFVILLVIFTISSFGMTLKAGEAHDIDNQCDGDHTSWTALSATGGTLASGYYYLSDDLTLLNNITITTGTVNICLNGNILWGATGSDQSIFTVTGGTLNIYDCNKDNKVHSYKIKEVMPDATQDMYYGNPLYSNKLFQRYYDFNDIGDGVIVGGVITGGHKFSTKTNLKDEFTYEGGGSAFLIGGSSGTVKFYGGTISGNTVTALSQWGGKQERSGVVGVIDGGTFNFYNGQIVGNSSRNGGAGIYLFGNPSSPARANIYGGIIKDNYTLDAAYNYVPESSKYMGGAALGTDNPIGGESIVSISGTPQMIDNMCYDYATNSYISTNMSYSMEALNSFKIVGPLYYEGESITTYARIGLFGGEGSQLTSGYTTSGNTHEDVNKIFFADDITQAVAYNSDNGELKYVASNLYTLTYHANDGTENTSNVSVVDKISVNNSLFQRTGYIFLNWNTEPDDTGTKYSPDDILTLTSNQNLYAIWARARYQINYWTNGGTLSSEPTSYIYGNVLTLPIPTWGGKTFEGWFDNAMLTGTAITQVDSTSSGDKTYYAKWSGVNHYTITSTAVSNGTITPAGSIIYDGTSQEYFIEPSNGYKIATFTVNEIDRKAELVGNTFIVSGITADTSINVTFEKILSTDITVYSSSGDNGTISPKGYTIVSSGSNLTYNITPQMGYTISDVLVNGTSVGAVSTYTLNNITSSQMISVEFTIVTSSLVLNYNGGEYTGSATIPTIYIEGIGFTLPTSSEMSKLRYTFGGWYDNETLEGTLFTEVSSTDTGAKAYWATWTINQYTISFDSNDGSVVSAITQNYNTNVTKPADPTKLGYTFENWYQDSELTQVYTFTTIPAENKTLYAKWTINQYMLSFNSDGGSVVSTIIQNYNTNVTKPANPTKLGYTFENWYQDSELTQVYTFTTMPAESKTLYAKWTINQYMISFDSNDGSAVSSITQNYNTNVTKPVDPTKLGYTFIDWYQDSELTQVYTFTTMPAENKTLYAKWTINQYMISFDSNGGSAVSSITQNYNTNVTKPVDPTKLGYTFIDWYQDSELTQVYTFTTMPAENKTLYAKWTINQYSITFNTNGGSVVSAITQNYNTNVTKPVDPTKLGYTFIYWYQDSELTQVYTFTTMPAENKTLYAKWTINQYMISFDSNGGSAVSAITQNYNTNVTKPADPTKSEYTFENWYQDSGLTQVYTFTTMPAENKTLYAKWTINQYTISFDSNGGSVVSAITQNYNTNITKPANPTKLGYTFVDWYSDGTLTQVYTFTTMPAENKTLYAKWTINQYTIGFDSNGGSEVSSITQNYNIAVIQPSDPTKLGYTFVDWYQDSELTQVYTFTTMPAESKMLYAKWTINQYSISFDSNDGSAVSTIIQNYNTNVTKPDNPTKLGYTFVDWCFDEELTQVYTFTTMPAENKTLYAKWTINQYSITFNTNGGSAVSAITQSYNTNVTKPADPTKLGYTFVDWYQDSGLTQVYTFTTMPAENKALYAKWTINQYMIIFDSNDGSAVSTITQNYNTNVTKPANPTKLGYTFVDWYQDSGLTQVYTFTTMPAENKTLYAKWTINQYSITFNTNGGSAVSEIIQNYNTNVTKPDNPTKTGYTFVDWYSDEELTQVYTFTTMLAENKTLYAKWMINQYSITFNTNGGTLITTITQNYNTEVSIPADPTREGYEFNGWSQAIPTIIPADNITLAAYWFKVSETNDGLIESHTEGLLDAIDSELIENKNVEVEIVIEEKITTDVDQVALDLIEQNVDKNQKYILLDISVIVKTEGSENVVINELTQKITIRIKLAEADQGYSNYQVVRIHNGQSEILDCVYDEESQTISFETDRFSNYAIVYNVPSASWAWWFLLLLLVPIGYVVYRKRDYIKRLFIKKQ